MDLWKSGDDFHFERNAMDLAPRLLNLREGISAIGVRVASPSDLSISIDDVILRCSLPVWAFSHLKLIEAHSQLSYEKGLGRDWQRFMLRSGVSWGQFIATRHICVIHLQLLFRYRYMA